MSFKIDAREVLSYLNQLGYKNIDAMQLQAFIKDLKKLMKYEERQCNEPEIIKVSILRTLDLEEKENLDSTPNVRYFEVPTSQFSTAVELNDSKINTPVRRPSTEPSKTLTSKEKNKENMSFEPTGFSTVACPVHFFKSIDCRETPRSKSVGTACTCPIDAYSQVSSSCVKTTNNKKGKRPASSTSESKIETNTTDSFPKNDDKIYSRYSAGTKTKKSTSSRHQTHDFTHPCNCPSSLKPKSAVIKCNIDTKPAFPKCDPVNLHKYYQRQWKLNKIPGENISREQKFRWCFREKISCGPPQTRMKRMKLRNKRYREDKDSLIKKGYTAKIVIKKTHEEWKGRSRKIRQKRCLPIMGLKETSPLVISVLVRIQNGLQTFLFLCTSFTCYYANDYLFSFINYKNIKDLKKLRKYEERKDRHSTSNLKTEPKIAKRRRSVKIILTKPSGSIISLTDDSNIEPNLQDSKNVSKILDPNINALKLSYDKSDDSIIIVEEKVVLT